MILISYGTVLLIIIAVLIVASIIAFILIKPFNIMYSRYKINKKLKDFLGENNIERLYRVHNLPYDYEMILRNSRYFIYLLPNPKNYDIHFIDDRFYFMDKHLKTKKKIKLGSFYKFEPAIDKNRETKKLIIVYPNTDFIYNHLDNVNKVFVYVNDLVGGIYIVSATDLYNLEEL
ncbi:MAG: hypothetical protein K6G48_06970 [Acholeplasmatales bacterium]|nr:hypothetical protein [Acholeplasmatales bacterium]